VSGWPGSSALAWFAGFPPCDLGAWVAWTTVMRLFLPGKMSCVFVLTVRKVQFSMFGKLGRVAHLAKSSKP
jgi:hypothetical protein